MIYTLWKSYCNDFWTKLVWCLGCMMVLMNAVAASSLDKSRIIVTTDITNEPDDQESLVRLLVYSNSFDIEGLIGSTGIWKLADPATHVIHECIAAYGRIKSNLVLHDSEFPTEAYLHGITTSGNRGYGMSSVGYRPSARANMIIEAVDRDYPRPVWLLAWGGANNPVAVINGDETKQVLNREASVGTIVKIDAVTHMIPMMIY